MAAKSLEKRVENLEVRVGILERLPKRIEANELQLLQLREEFRAEFSAVREEIRVGTEVLREEIRAGDEETRRYMRVLHEDVIARIALLGEGR